MTKAMSLFSVVACLSLLSAGARAQSVTQDDLEGAETALPAARLEPLKLEALPALAPAPVPPGQTVASDSAAAPAGAPAQSQPSKGSSPAPSGGAGKTASSPSGPGPSFPLSPSSQDTPEKKALDKVSIENQLFQAELTKQLQKLTKEKEELRAQADLLAEQLRLELTKIDNSQKVAAAKIESKYRLRITELETEQKKLSAENQLAEELFKAEMAKLRTEREKLKTDNDLKDEELRARDQVNDERRKTIDMDMREMDIKEKKLKLDEEEARSVVEKLRIEGDRLRTETDRLKNDLELRAKKEDWKSEANKEPDYLKNPFDKGILTITDRRISLNGPIVTGVADYVTDRIDYYNNKSSELPIFIVIDRCPGGSVMEGYRIVKAMQSSKAPVHVIVKSFAASMAAVITTLAQQSYAYPNAVILHHQMSTMQWGNMTQLKEQLDIAKEWYKRLAEPVAKKMGTSLDDFTKQMYSHNSDGDWEEFGDKAVALKWVNNVVQEIRETGIVKDPEKAEKGSPPNKFSEKTDEKGQRYVSLPRLEPFDLYWIYNPDKYYR